jgi:putative inorganic carbon (HCO3(-)) transporter
MIPSGTILSSRRDAAGPPGRGPGAPRRLAIAAAGTLAVGIGSGVVAVALGGAPAKYGAAAVAALVLAVALLACRSAARAERLLVALFALSVPFNFDVNFLYRAHVGGAPGLTVTASFVAALLLLVVRARRGRAAPAQPSALVLLAFPALYLLAGVLSLSNAEHRSLVLFEAVRVVALMGVLLAFLGLRDHRTIRVFLLALTVGVLIEAVLAVLQHQLNLSLGLERFADRAALLPQRLAYERTLSRATGTIGHPNVLGYYLEILLPLAFGLLLSEERPAWRGWYLAVVLAAALGMFATLSRGAWLTLAFSLPLVLFGTLRGRLLRLRTALAVTGLALCAAGIGLAVHRDIERRLLQRDFRSVSSRMPLNEAAWSIVQQHPILGIGLNNFEEEFKSRDTTGHSRIFKGYRQVVHNMYLLVWTEVGTPGLVAFVAAVLVPIGVALRRARHAKGWQRGVLVGAGAGLGAQLLHGAFDPGFRTQIHIGVLVFALIGLIGAVARLADDGAARRAGPERARGAGGLALRGCPGEAA